MIQLLLPLLLTMLLTMSGEAQIVVNQFEGIDASTSPWSQFTVDPNGAVGTKQYLEWTDSAYQGYNKKAPFAPVYASPLLADTPWVQNKMSDCSSTNGNGVILFDHLASRWVIGVRQGSGTTGYFYCIAISSTDDLTANNFSWYTYELPLDAVMGQNAQGNYYFPDYPKIATWSDAYYVTIDLMNPNKSYQVVGIMVCAFDRKNMLTGGAAQTPQCFKYPGTFAGQVLYHSLLPADIDGTTPPPEGLAEYFVSIENPPVYSGSLSLNLWQFHVDWTTPSNSTFTGPVPLKVSSYIPGCYTTANPLNTYCVPEPTSSATGNYVDSVGDRVMHRFAYRRFLYPNPHDIYLISHTVQVGTGPLSRTGIRWYELGTGGVALKAGTINPGDGNYRFVPSIAEDRSSNMAVGYSVSGTALHPSIRASYLKLPLGTPTEFNILTSKADEEDSPHWGGYTGMSVDPVDDCTFWFVNEYFSVNQTGGAAWRTRIANFKVPTCH